MSRVFHDIKVGLDEDLEERLSWLSPGYGTFRVLKKSVDARQRHNPHHVYSVEVFDPNETPPQREFHLEPATRRGSKPLIIGAGPAGLFAALRFVERGIPCALFEQGSECVRRMKSINRFWRYGELDPVNNVCFGEGGAGLYSDGKLITRIKSPHIPYVLNRLVRFGAPSEIEYLSNPHVGSDRIRRVIPKMREYILKNGGEIHFDTKVTRLITRGRSIEGIETHDGTIHHSDKIILAVGHSAEDMFHHLGDIGVHMEGKSFALGLRIEHPQTAIDKIQFREAAGHPKLGSASYRLAHHDKQTDIGVYSFCMCPGGYVLSSGTSLDGVVCNGMSNYNRGSPFANAAIVVTVDHKNSFGNDVWGGMKFRRQIETHAHQLVRQAGGSHELPAQRLTDFLNGRSGPTLPSSSPSHVRPVPLHDLLPSAIYKNLKIGLEKFDTQMHGFLSDEAQLHGVESRTSCPLRVTRDSETLQSLSHAGLYPCGEGTGYAGGITSAACDGIRIADKICDA